MVAGLVRRIGYSGRSDLQVIQAAMYGPLPARRWVGRCSEGSPATNCPTCGDLARITVQVGQHDKINEQRSTIRVSTFQPARQGMALTPTMGLTRWTGLPDLVPR